MPTETMALLTAAERGLAALKLCYFGFRMHEVNTDMSHQCQKAIADMEQAIKNAKETKH